MDERKRLMFLILIMAAIGIIGGGATVAILYQVAIEPNSAVNLGGFVAVNLDEMRTLFIWAGGIVAAIAVVVNVVGGVLFFRLTDPIIRHLHETENRLFSVADAAIDAIITANSAGNIISWNKGAALIFGYDEEEILGSSLSRIIPERFRSAHTAALESAAKTGKTSLVGNILELQGLHKDGKEFPLELSLGSWKADGDSFFIGIVRDISERKQLEAKIIQSEKMATIGTMTAGIGHEINNPLYAIQGLAEAVRDGNDIPESNEYGGDIVKYCRQISQIVKNLSGYVRPAESHELKPIDINEKINEAIDSVRRSCSSDSIIIEKNLEPLPEIAAKPEEMQQVFFNVIRNSAQAMGYKGDMKITSHHLNGHISVRIKDSGTGIAAEDMEKLFDPFFTTKGPDEGEGIGLYVVRKIIDKYSGTIVFESKKGEGATCVIDFPTQEIT